MISAQRRVVLLLFVCLLVAAPSAFADGKVFTQAVAAPVNTPDQRALLHFEDGVQRLVIETSFVGEGTHFAWVVPLPSGPRIEAVSENFFTQLNATFQPKLVHKASRAWMLYGVFGALLASCIWLQRREGRKGLLTWLVFLGVAGLLAVLAIPNFVTARGSLLMPTVNTVRILDQQQVGIYDTVTVESDDGRALLDWLNTHGFYTPTNALPVISSYAAQRWVFAAIRIHRDSAADTRSQPHPLAFTFETERAVYPLRLTGIENGKCAIELFVFGPARAEASGFKVEHCGEPFGLAQLDLAGTPRELFMPPLPGDYRIANPELHKLALPAPVVTKLVGTLDPKEMQSDAWIDWVPFKPALPTLYSSTAALAASMDWFASVAVIGLLLAQLAAPRLSRRTCLRIVVAILTLATVCGLARLATVKITEIEVLRGGPHWAINHFRQLDAAIQQYALDQPGEPGSFDEFKSALDTYLKGRVHNCFTDKPLRNEASPGNLILRQTVTGTDVVWHDIHANPHVLATFPK